MKRTLGVVFGSAFILSLIAVAVGAALSSQQFNVQSVEVEDRDRQASPLDFERIVTLAAIKTGEDHLFKLSLDEVHERVLSHAWIKSAVVQKRFPGTVSILVDYREPKALVQNHAGQLAYVDETGKVFGSIQLSTHADFPVISGIAWDQKELMKRAVQIIESWSSAPVAKLAPVSTLHFDSERGYRLLVSYSIPGGRSRTWVSLGDLSTESGEAVMNQRFARLSEVFARLTEQARPARHVWADAGKKVVVKFTHGS